MRLGAFVILWALAQAASKPAPPATLLGEFVDDYGGRYRLSDSLFEQLPRSRYRIVEWNAAEQFFIAQNAETNPGDAGLWTRIDWMLFDDMPPFTWGFCMTAYNASSADAARATTAANRAVPRTGCNGYPFSRMKRSE